MAARALTPGEEGFLQDLLSEELEPAKPKRIVERLRSALRSVVDTRRLALEVATASDTAEEFQRRIDHYLLEGPGLVLAIYPSLECVFAFEGTSVRRLSKSDSIEAPGLRVALSEIFAD